MDELHAMKLHDSIDISEKLEVLRVPGGWIYIFLEYLDPDNDYCSRLVPSKVQFVPNAYQSDDLLRKYMKHILESEGIDYLDHGLYNDISQYELEQLEQISTELKRELS